MAKLLPPRYLPSSPNRGEEIIFNKFIKSNDTDDWFVLNSLLQQAHVRKKYGEIDFVVLAPRYGIFCLEVKGSYSIKRIDGTWIYLNKNGAEDYRKYESPFHQANTNMQSLKRFISNKLGENFNDLNFGYGVVFTQLSYETNSPEEESHMIYDRKKWI